MIKRIFIHFLSLSIILLLGMDFLSTQLPHDTLLSESFKEYHQVQKLITENSQGEITRIAPASSSDKQKSHKKIDVTENEIEEDKLSPGKKYYEDNITISVISFKFLYYSIGKHIPLFQRSYLSPHTNYDFLHAFRL